MRRILSLTLALVMVLGSFSTVMAADGVVINEAASFLKTKGVLVGDEKGDLMLGDNLKRRDAVILLSRLMGVEAEASNYVGVPTWGDVDELPGIYTSYLAWAQAKGYFEGKDSYNFGPNTSLTVPEYATVLLRALEYETKGADAWTAALENANKLGLLEDLDVNFGTVVTRGQMAVMTFNALGTTINGKSETLAESLNITLPVIEKEEAEKLDIKEVKTENLKEVIVELSKSKIDEKDVEKLENEKNYRLTGFIVEKATLEDNEVVLEINKALVKGKKYDLVVRNVGRDLNGTYEFEARDNEIPTVESVEVLGEYGIKVTTSEPIRKASERDFEIDGRNISMTIETYGRDIIITPYHNEKFSDKAETLTIKSLEDYAGFKASKEDFEIKIVEDKVAPEVVKVSHRGNIVEVEFDKDVRKESIEAYKNRRDEGNIMYLAGRVEEFATKAEKIDTNKVRYAFERELPRRAKVTIEGVENHSKVAMVKGEFEIEESLDYTEPEIIDEDVVVNVEDRTATITLEFDREVEGREAAEGKDGFDIDHHVSIYERETSRRNELEGKIVSVDYGRNKTYIVIELEDLTINNTRGDYDYTAEVRNFTDVSSLRNRMYTSYVDFELVAEDAKFNLEDIVIKENRNSTDIEVRFNNPVDLKSVEREDNYLILDKKNGKLKDIKELDGKIYLTDKGETVVIELPDFKVADYEYLVVSKLVRDIDDNRLGQDYTYNFEQETIDNGEFKLARVDGKIELTPNAGVKKATLTTNLKNEFVIKGNLEELVVNAPNADITIAVGVTVDTLKINSIKADTLNVEGTLKNLKVSTNKSFRVYGNILETKITTTEKVASVKVAQDKAGEFKVVTLAKGETKDLGTELGVAKVREVKVTVTNEGVEFAVLNAEGVAVVPVEGKYNLVKGATYTIRAEGFKAQEIKIEDETVIVIELEKIVGLEPLVPATPIKLDKKLAVTKAGIALEEFVVTDAEGVVQEAKEGVYKLAVGAEYKVKEAVEEGAVTSTFKVVVAEVEGESVYAVEQAELVDLVVSFVVEVVEIK